MVTRVAASGLLSPKYRAVALSLMASMAMASYNNLSVTAALPDIGDDLGRVTLLPWVVTVELVSAAIAVLAVGPFIDGAGARRAFRLTSAAFLVTSGMCAVAPSMELLVAARVLQGFGTGALIGTSVTCIGLVFEEAVRPWAYALLSSVWGNHEHWRPGCGRGLGEHSGVAGCVRSERARRGSGGGGGVEPAAGRGPSRG